MLANKTPLSYSRMSVYEACPLQYDYKFLQKLPDELGGPLLLGSKLHDFFELYGKHCIKNKLQSDPSEWRAIAEEALLKDKKQHLPVELLPRYYQLAEAFVDSELYNLETVYEVEQSLAFNKDWQTVQFFAKNVAFRLKMDRVDYDEATKVATVTDYKTGFNEGDPFQLEIYAAATFLILAAEKVIVKFDYIGSNYVSTKTFTYDQKDELIEKIEFLAAKIAGTKTFKATPGKACSYCAYATRCTAKPSDIEVVETEEQAKQVATDIALMDAKAKKKKTNLKAWVEKNGPVHADTITYDFTRSEKFEVLDLAKFVEAAKGYGMAIGYDLMGISSTVLKKLFKKNDGLFDAVQNVVDVGVTETFKGVKPKKKTPEVRQESPAKSTPHKSKLSGPKPAPARPKTQIGKLNK